MLVLKDILIDLLENGRYKEDRTKVGRYSVYGKQASFNLLDSFPAITLRKLPFKTAVKELLWFISGSSDNSVLVEQGINYWTPFADPITNSVGPMYGSQLRSSYTVHHVDGRQVVTKRDLLLEAIYNLKHRPNASDNVYTLWNPSTKPDYSLDYATNVKAGKGALALCHGTVVQLHVVDLNKAELQLVNSRNKEAIDKALDRLELKGAARARLATEADIASIVNLLKAKQIDPSFYFNTKGLILQHYQRSQDVLALGFNIAQYALLTHLLARAVRLVPLQYIHQWGDLHYYSNQLDSLKALVAREPLAIKPKLLINTENRDIDKYHYNDFSLVNYQHHPDLEFKLNS